MSKNDILIFNLINDIIDLVYEKQELDKKINNINKEISLYETKLLTIKDEMLKNCE